MNRNKVVWVFVTLLGASVIIFLQDNRSFSAPQKPPVEKFSIADYQKWGRINEKPHLVFSRLAMLCRLLSPEEEAEEKANPHLDKFVNVYVNELGRKAMLHQRKPAFPVGSVIVKEKLSAANGTTPELLTVMRKREKGYNPENGDWEYSVRKNFGSKIEAQGRLKNCQSCHAQWKASDYVSRTYLTEAMRKHLK